MPPIPNLEKTLLDKAIADEQESIDVYTKLIAACKNGDDTKTYKMIRFQEQAHKRILEKIKKSESKETE
jgi:rubrerythrin